MGTSLICRVPGRHSYVALALFTIAIFASLAGRAVAEERKIEFYNIHTKESISIVYKRDGKFIPEALQKLNYFMRDWRRDITIEMDPDLIDLIWDIHRELGSKQPVHLICGHRSGATNEMLRRTRGGQARGSMHISGKAADIQFPDVSAKQLRNSALIRERGGVGYYPTSAIPFVHVDTGRVRHWPRLPRQELALLFPSGHSQHIPADGRPITKQDFKIALANLQQRGGELPIAVQRRLQGGGEARTVLAGLTPPPPAATQAPVQEQKPQLVFASLTPFAGLGESLSSGKADTAQPAIVPRVQQTAAHIGNADIFRRDSAEQAPSDTVPEDQMAAAPDYDDDHPDELDYQPFPILPLMSDVPVAFMDLSGDAQQLDLQKVHLFFSESRAMLHTQFEPGLQYARLYWAQKFQGTAVNTALKRVARDEPAEPPAEQTAQLSARTARK